MGDLETAAALGEQRGIYEQIQPTLQGYSSEPLLTQAQAADELLMSHLRPDNAGMISDMRQHLQKAMGKRIEDFKTDPASFAAQSPYVNDPNISTEERATRSIEAQIKLGAGLPGFRPQVMSKQQALDIKNAYDKAPTTDKYDMVQSLNAEYGRFFQEVSEEATLPSFVTALGPALNDLPQTVMEKLMTASSLSTNEIPGIGNEKNKADAQAQVSSSKFMQIMQGTAALLSSNEDQVKGVAALQDAAMKANLLGMDLNDIDREYNTVNDSGFLLAVPKSQGDIRDVIKALEYKRLNVVKDMTGDAANYIDVLAARERLLDLNTTVWTMRGSDFVLIDRETQGIALDNEGQPIIVNQAEIPGLTAYTKELQAVTQEKAEEYDSGFSF